MSTTLTFKAVTGTIKKLARANFKMNMGFGGLFNSSATVTVNINDTLGYGSNGELVAVPKGSSFDLELAIDNAEGGPMVYRLVKGTKATFVSGTAKITKAANVNYADGVSDVSSAGTTAGTGSVAYAGDFIVIGAGDTAQFTFSVSGYGDMVFPPPDQPCEMPGLEEGANQVNEF